MARLRIKTKLLILFLSIGASAIGLTAWLGYSTGKRALEKAVFDQLTAVRASKAYQIERYFKTMEAQVETLARSTMLTSAMNELAAGFDQAGAQPGEEWVAAQTAALREYYDHEFLPRLRANKPEAESAEPYFPAEPGRIRLQHAYIAANPSPVGKKDELARGAGEGAYHAAHDKFHQIFREFIQKFGYYDMFLVTPGGDIVYTVFKETDYTTNLRTGPYAGTGLARAAIGALESADEKARIADFEFYDPSYGAPAAFIAAPIREGGRLLGALAFQMPVDEINRVMTGNMNWPRDGLGQSGETYLVGPDFRMRSVSRFLIQEPENYLTALRGIGTDPETVEKIQAFKTSILLQEVRTGAAEAALEGKTDTSIIPDYRNVPVLSSYTPLALGNLKWALLSEIDVAEAFAPIRKFQRLVALSAAGLLALIAGLALVFTQAFTRPVEALIEATRRVSKGDLAARAEIPNRDEFGELAGAFNKMVGDIEAQTALIARKNEENERLLLNILPLPIANRLRGGEDKIADAFSEVTVLFADLVGFTRMSAELGAENVVDLLNDLFSDFDVLARKHGVEKIKTIGDCYMAVCGLPHPRADHAEAVAELALDMIERIGAISLERETALRLRIGINTGPVVAGVIGTSKFIYDLWGDTVNMASRMESHGMPNVIQVTQAVADKLSGAYVFEERGLVDVRGKGMTTTFLLRGRQEMRIGV